MQGFYFKPTLSARKHKCSGNVDGTTFLFLKVCRVAQLCLIFNIWTAVLQASLAMGILQTRILEWVAMTSSKGSSRPRDQTCISYISCIGRQVLYLSRHCVVVQSPICV